MFLENLSIAEEFKENKTTSHSTTNTSLFVDNSKKQNNNQI